jgi:hypothetical protein
MRGSATAARAMQPTRRRLLTLAPLTLLPALPGCGTPLPLAPTRLPAGVDATAARWLRDCADRHGRSAFAALRDINVAYDGRWRPLIDRIQPEVVDKPWRQSSEERLLLRDGIIAQAHRGPAGAKQVWRQSARLPGQQGDVRIWYDGRPDAREGVRQAAALVADCYVFFLLGPLWLHEQVAAGRAPLALGERVRVDGRACQWVEAWLQPGFGLSAGDRASLAIDRDDLSCRRLRFTLEGYPGTQGAVAEVDWLALVRRHGIWWPAQSYERVVHPLPDFPAHDWQLTGLDVNRGYDAAALQGPVFAGAAAAPAAAFV